MLLHILHEESLRIRDKKFYHSGYLIPKETNVSGKTASFDQGRINPLGVLCKIGFGR
jgi:hypothetical protein